MKKNLLVLFVFAMMVTFILTAQAGASYVSYTDNTAWGTAAGPYLTENFSDTTLNTGLSFTYDGDRDVGYGGAAPHVDTTYGYFWDRLKQLGGTPAWTTTWHFATPITAFGGTWDLSVLGRGVGITLLAGSDVVGTILNPGTTASFNGFYGFTSTTAFDTVLLEAGSQYAGTSNLEAYTLDNLVYSPVPIPPAIWLLGTGLIGLIGLRRHINV